MLEADGLRLPKHYVQNIRPLITPTLARCWQACQNTDVIVSTFHVKNQGLIEEAVSAKPSKDLTHKTEKTRKGEKTLSFC